MNTQPYIDNEADCRCLDCIEGDERERIIAARDIAQDRVQELEARVVSLEGDRDIDAEIIDQQDERLGTQLWTISSLREELDAIDEAERGHAFIDGALSLLFIGVVTGIAFAIAQVIFESLG